MLTELLTFTIKFARLKGRILFVECRGSAAHELPFPPTVSAELSSVRYFRFCIMVEISYLLNVARGYGHSSPTRLLLKLSKHSSTLLHVHQVRRVQGELFPIASNRWRAQQNPFSQRNERLGRLCHVTTRLFGFGTTDRLSESQNFPWFHEISYDKCSM
jgi:hypothetical protein